MPRLGVRPFIRTTIIRHNRIQVRFHDGEWQALLQLAERTGRSPNDLLRYLLIEACKEHHVTIPDPPKDTRPGAFALPPLKVWPKRKRKPKVAKVEELDYTIGEDGKVVTKPKAGG